MAERDPRYFKVYQDGDDRELEQKIQQIVESGAAPGIDMQARESIEEIQRKIDSGEIGGGGGGGGAGVDSKAREDIQKVSTALAEKVYPPLYVDYKDWSFGTMTKPNYAQLITLWDEVMRNDFKKNVLGKDNSGQYDIYCYERGSKALPTIIVNIGADAHEWKTPLVMMKFMQEILTGDQPYLRQLKDRFRWLVIPWLNPWGMENGIVGADNSARLLTDRFDSGAKEANMLKDLIDREAPLHFYLDCHSQGDAGQLLMQPNPTLLNRAELDRYSLTAVKWRERVKRSIGLNGSPVLYQAKTTQQNASSTLFSHYVKQYKKANFAVITEPFFNLPDNEFQQSYFDLLIELFLNVVDGKDEPFGFVDKVFSSPPELAKDECPAISSRAYFVKFYNPAPRRVTRLTCRLTVASDQLNLGIYDADGFKLAGNKPYSVRADPLVDLGCNLGVGWYYAAIAMAPLTTGVYSVIGNTAPTAQFTNATSLDSAYPLPDKVDVSAMTARTSTPCIIITGS